MTIENKTILIIDDDARNIFALAAVLRSKGFACITAQGAQEGIDLLSTPHSIGILLMDVMMPEMDGLEAIRHIRKIRGMDNIPIVAITAQAMVGDKERCLAAGANEYLSKPVNIDLLMVLLKRYMT